MDADTANFYNEVNLHACGFQPYMERIDAGNGCGHPPPSRPRPSLNAVHNPPLIFLKSV